MFLSTRRRRRADNLRTKPPTMPLFYSSSKVSVAHLHQLNDFGINLSQEMLMRPTRRPPDHPTDESMIYARAGQVLLVGWWWEEEESTNKFSWKELFSIGMIYGISGAKLFIFHHRSHPIPLACFPILCTPAIICFGAERMAVRTSSHAQIMRVRKINPRVAHIFSHFS